MLSDRITNQDEDEVEDELAALEREVNGPEPETEIEPPHVAPLPAAPKTEPLKQPDIQQPERQPERQPMLAS